MQPISHRKAGGRGKELTVVQRNVMRQLRARGQTYEQIAVGFGVSYNTTRSVVNSPEEAEE